MLKLDLDTKDLLKTARLFEQIPRKSKASIAQALNVVGEEVVKSMAHYMSQQVGIDEDAIRKLVLVKDASPDDLTWEMDASAVAPPSGDWERPWDRRTEKGFQADALVKILTMEDDKVCKICEDAAENGPYTLEEAQRMFQHGADGKAGLHPECRCMIGPWSQQTGLVSVKFGQAGAPPQLFTVRQMGRKVAEAVQVSMRAALKDTV